MAKNIESLKQLRQQLQTLNQQIQSLESAQQEKSIQKVEESRKPKKKEVRGKPIEEITDPSILEKAISDFVSAARTGIVSPVVEKISPTKEEDVTIPELAGGKVSARSQTPVANVIDFLTQGRFPLEVGLQRLLEDKAFQSDFLKMIAPITKPQSREQELITKATGAFAEQAGLSPEELRKDVQRRGSTIRRELSGAGEIRLPSGARLIIGDDGSIRKV